MKLVIDLKDNQNVLATIAIGDKYYKEWERYALPTWKQYCVNNDLGLVVFDKDLIDKKHEKWKKPTWQKLLIGETLKNSKYNVNNVCYLDSDIIINPLAPNIFDFHSSKLISVVSQVTNIPYPKDDVLRRIAFFRHNCYDTSYPLDSALFMTPQQIYHYHKLEEQKDYFCAGLFVFNVLEYHSIMKEWFMKYGRDVSTITGGGDEPIMNFEIQNYGKVNWLEYEFQSLWLYEMAWKYPFLYQNSGFDNGIIKQCVEASLFTNYFMHFAGSWYESEMWKIDGILQSNEMQNNMINFKEYLKSPVTGTPKGRINPQDGCQNPQPKTV